MQLPTPVAETMYLSELTILLISLQETVHDAEESETEGKQYCQNWKFIHYK